MKRTHARPTPQQRARARHLRKNATPCERVLWSRLRRKQVMGFKFRRQHCLPGAVVDFFCCEAGLVVEVDGPVHDDASELDRRRTMRLMEMGYEVVRVSNEDVRERLEDVLATIRARLVACGREAG